MNKLKANITYMLIQMTMWGVYGVIIVFATNFLEANGVDKIHTSLILGIAAASSCILQILTGELAERSARVKVYALYILTNLLIAAGGILMLKNGGLAVAGFAVAATLVQIIGAYANSLGMNAVGKGAPLQYGIARGLGSFSYASLSVLLGELIREDRMGMVAIPVAALILAGVMTVAVWCFHRSVERFLPEDRAPRAEKKKSSFIREHPRFCLFLLGAILLNTCHNLLSSYIQFIVERVGGGRTEQGIAIGICAYVELPIMFAFGLLTPRVRMSRLLRLSALFYVIKGIGFYLAPNVGWIYATQAMQILENGLFAMASVYYAAQVISQDQVVRAQSYLASTISAGCVIAMSLGGVLCDLLGVPMMILCALGAGVAGTVITFIATGKPKTAPVRP